MTRDDVLKEFVDCRCRYVCECYEFVYEAMADEIVALRAERDALRKDAALLDALQTEHERFDPVCALVVKVRHDRNGSDWANVAGDVRAALTAAAGGA
jgi:hypothetical protein